MCGGGFILLSFRYETNMPDFSKMIAEKSDSFPSEHPVPLAEHKGKQHPLSAHS